MKEREPKTLKDKPEEEPQEKHEPEAEKKPTELSDEELGGVAGGGGGGSGTRYSDARLKARMRSLA